MMRENKVSKPMQYAALTTIFMLLAALVAGCGPSDQKQEQLEANKELVRQLGAINDAADWDRLDTLLSDDFHRHSMATTERPEITSLEEFKQHEQAIRAIWPDRHVTYEMIIAEGDLAAAYATFAATNKETGKPIELKYLVMMRMKDSKIAEIWVEWDNLSVQKQLGLWPSTAAAAMPPEAGKAIARRWFDEVINQRNLDAIADIYSPDYIYHGRRNRVTRHSGDPGVRRIHTRCFRRPSCGG